MKYSKFPRTIVPFVILLFFFNSEFMAVKQRVVLFPLIPFPWNNLCTHSQHSQPTTITLKKVQTNKNKIVYSKMESTNIHFSYLYLFSTVFAAVMIKRANFENLWIQWMIMMIIVIELNVCLFFYRLIFFFLLFLFESVCILFYLQEMCTQHILSNINRRFVTFLICPNGYLVINLHFKRL